MKNKQNSYRSKPKPSIFGSGKVLFALFALNAAGVIMYNQTHETSYLDFIKDTAKETLHFIHGNTQAAQRADKKSTLRDTLKTDSKKPAEYSAGLKDTLTHKTENVTLAPPLPPAIKTYYTSDGKPIDPTIQSTVIEIAAQYELCPFDLFAQIEQESAYNPEAVSSAGAQGLMQFMPKTWEHYGRDADVFDMHDNIEAGARMMKDLLKKYKGDKDLALAAYNAGSGNVDKWLKKDKDNWKSYAFKETAAYIEGISKKSERMKIRTSQPMKLAQFSNRIEK